MGMLVRSEGTYVDNAAHRLYHAGRSFPCDREIEALALWHGHALLLSSDTDCLSLWDGDGLIRTARVGVYPQDMSVSDDTAYICGGADGRLHLLHLPDLSESAEYSLPGMPERVHVRAASAWVLTLLPEQEVCTALLQLDLSAGHSLEITRFAGIPGALTADDTGLWIGVSEQVLHLPYGTAKADMVVEGIGLARRILVENTGVWVEDSLEENRVYVRT